eukprot:Opistho-1_new@47540
MLTEPYLSDPRVATIRHSRMHASSGGAQPADAPHPSGPSRSATVSEPIGRAFDYVGGAPVSFGDRTTPAQKSAHAACGPCRRSHKACDGNLPCSDCTRAGNPSRCHYLPPKKKGRKPKADKLREDAAANEYGQAPPSVLADEIARASAALAGSGRGGLSGRGGAAGRGRVRKASLTKDVSPHQSANAQRRRRSFGDQDPPVQPSSAHSASYASVHVHPEERSQYPAPWRPEFEAPFAMTGATTRGSHVTDRRALSIDTDRHDMGDAVLGGTGVDRGMHGGHFGQFSAAAGAFRRANPFMSDPMYDVSPRTAVRHLADELMAETHGGLSQPELPFAQQPHYTHAAGVGAGAHGAPVPASEYYPGAGSYVHQVGVPYSAYDMSSDGAFYQQYQHAYASRAVAASDYGPPQARVAAETGRVGGMRGFSDGMHVPYIPTTAPTTHDDISMHMGGLYDTNTDSNSARYQLAMGGARADGIYSPADSASSGPQQR